MSDHFGSSFPSDTLLSYAELDMDNSLLSIVMVHAVHCFTPSVAILLQELRAIYAPVNWRLCYTLGCKVR